MIAVALKGLAGRKVRALLTALAVVIGVSMVSGTFILTDTMQKSFNGLFAATYANTDAVDQRQGGRQELHQRQRQHDPGIDAGQGRALPEVEAAGGGVAPAEANVADIIGTDGKAVAKESVGGSYRRRQRRSSARSSSRPASRPAGPARSPSTPAPRPSSTTRSATRSSSRRSASSTRTEITGTVSFGSVDSLGFASIAAWDVKTAQTLLASRGPLRRRSRSPPSTARRPRSSCAAIKPLAARQPAGEGQRRRRRRRTPTELNDGMAMIRSTSCSASAASRCSSARS